MKQYHELLKTIIEKGADKSDRTGTGTRSVFGHQMRFDLSEGFPLVTTKKMFTRGAIEELLWFIRGSVDVGELQDRGVRFWDSWKREDSTIGKGYGAQMRGIRIVEEVEPRIFEKPSTLSVVRVAERETPDFPKKNSSEKIRVGDTYTSHKCGDYTVIKELSSPDKYNGRSYWKIQFEDTGYIRDIDYNGICENMVRDPYARTVYGVGYYGDISQKEAHYSKLVGIWRDMIKRCYEEFSVGYKSYGGKGVHVSARWHNFTDFYKDVIQLPNWSNKLEYWADYNLDKDILNASNCYHREVCMWATKDEQALNMNSMFFEAIKDGNTEIFPSIGKMQKMYGVSLSAVHGCLNGKLKTHHGWSNFKYVNVKEGHVLRYRQIDQLTNLICDIKHTPNSRRLIISLWNAHDIHRMELPCCHGNMIQFHVSGDGKLSCQMYQRSGDAFLGVPVNIASYALLTMMIAQVCNLEVGDFIHTLGDAHLYNNHIEQAKLQLTRDFKELPKMKINPDVKDIFSFKYEDFELTGYDPHPHIKGEVSV